MICFIISENDKKRKLEDLYCAWQQRMGPAQVPIYVGYQKIIHQKRICDIYCDLHEDMNV